MMRGMTGRNTTAFDRSALRVLFDAVCAPAIYTVALVACWWFVGAVDTPTPHDGVLRGAFAWLVAASVFIADRVKLRDAWLDPADLAAHPVRMAVLARNARLLRVTMIVCAAMATAIPAWITDGSPTERFALALLPTLALAGIVAYAPWPAPRARRPKDVVALKNLAVGAGLGVFSALAAGVGLDSLPSRVVLLVGLALAVRVAADAALCDLDDVEGDRAFGTRTLAVMLGRMRALGVAGAARCVAAIALIGACGATAAVVAFSVAWFITTIAIAWRARSDARIAPFVDVALAVELLVALAAAAVIAMPAGPA